jgi:hypothetical protein
MDNADKLFLIPIKREKNNSPEIEKSKFNGFSS